MQRTARTAREGGMAGQGTSGSPTAGGGRRVGRAPRAGCGRGAEGHGGPLSDDGTSVDPCDRARWELCCLAAGVPPGDDGVLLARHARRCRACERFADGLCRLRALLARAQGTLGRQPADAPLARRAREALARELRARLARDLLALGRGDPPREARLVEADLARLALLPGRGEADGVLRRWLAGGAPPARRRALLLAVRLDPLGLDLALDWLGVLARRGRDRPAQRFADRLLEVASTP